MFTFLVGVDIYLRDVYASSLLPMLAMTSVEYDPRSFWCEMTSLPFATVRDTLAKGHTTSMTQKFRCVVRPLGIVTLVHLVA